MLTAKRRLKPLISIDTQEALEANVSECPILMPSELAMITGRIRRSSQAKELDAMGIPYRLRSDKSIVVFRSELPGHESATKTKQRSPRLCLS